MMYYKHIYILLLIFLFISNSCIQKDDRRTDSNELLDREQERIEYLTSKSYDQLSAMLTPSMSYTHSNAIIETKEEYLEQLRSGRVVYRNMNHQNMEVRFINPETAVINGTSDVSVTVDGEDQEVSLRFTLVYVLVEGEWLFEVWHSTSRP